MAIKRRTNFTQTIAEPAEPKGLNIVAKPKKPLPAPSVSTIYDNVPGGIRRLGLVAQSLGEPAADAVMNVGDLVKLLRTPYDDKNPQEQRYRNRIRNRGTAITAMCVSCTGSRKAVTECLSTTCPLWAFRFGGDPFRGKRK